MKTATKVCSGCGVSLLSGATLLDTTFQPDNVSEDRWYDVLSFRETCPLSATGRHETTDAWTLTLNRFQRDRLLAMLDSDSDDLREMLRDD